VRSLIALGGSAKSIAKVMTSNFWDLRY
jgi:hypothetical protein